MKVSWTQLKQFVDARGLSIQWIEFDDAYQLKAFDDAFSLEMRMDKNPSDTTELDDFEDNYKALGNVPLLSHKKTVITQFERTDLYLKLARFGGNVASNEITIQIPVPTGGRYLSGGWGIVDTFDIDDYALVSLVDTDRIIAGLMGGLTDEQMQAEGTYPNYPEIMSFNDDELPIDNRGWYFYPAGGGVMGEVEFEPLGGYALLPEGMYLQIKVVRPNVSTGKVRGALFWGNKI